MPKGKDCLRRWVKETESLGNLEKEKGLELELDFGLQTKGAELEVEVDGDEQTEYSELERG